MPDYQLSHLDQLESEAIFILRETAAQFENPALLFSGGKDSIVMAHLAHKAFWPSRLPFPLFHIDTGHNFRETLEYRDMFAEKIGARLVVASVQKAIDSGRVQEEKGANASRNVLQITTLLDAIEENGFDAALGGGRRDEEKARAKEERSWFSFGSSDDKPKPAAASPKGAAAGKGGPAAPKPKDAGGKVTLGGLPKELNLPENATNEQRERCVLHPRTECARPNACLSVAVRCQHQRRPS